MFINVQRMYLITAIADWLTDESLQLFSGFFQGMVRETEPLTVYVEN